MLIPKAFVHVTTKPLLNGCKLFDNSIAFLLKFFFDSNVLLTGEKNSRGLRDLEKPEKIYPNNPNLIYAVSSHAPLNIENLGETFFINMADTSHKVTISSQGAAFFSRNCFQFITSILPSL
jgi:hypothetical protein